MTEYICRDKVLSYVYATHSAGGFRNEEDYLWLQEAVVDAAAADVKPVKHGWWNLRSRQISDVTVKLPTECSNCDFSEYNAERYNFCPNCGTRMDKEGDNGKFD